MEVSKEILILTSIGRIKWLKAPQKVDEIIFHLAKTFNVPELCISIKDCNTDTDVTPENYPLLVACDWDCIFKIEIDYTLKDAIMVSLEESRAKVQRSPPRSDYSSTATIKPSINPDSQKYDDSTNLLLDFDNPKTRGGKKTWRPRK
ncbi:hypothetical protein SteCoe_15277 [Stentor coeruleus]|uniref:Uncharacterized protein n=1 Tax=Stentor coeruleus TaxID=5963 RepID=A0A1R2C475_9CILI|nr:hypothetical protein SteCoe_15277 [Stentor coeruleus]